jgi:hypothetical protein
MSPRLLHLAIALVLAAPRLATAANIVSPPQDTLVASGTAVTVTVAAAQGEQISQVVFVTAAGTTTAPAGAVQANVPIPQNAVGPEFIVAIVRLTDGTTTSSVLRVAADPGPLKELIVAGPPLLDRIGQIVRLDVKGRFADGVVRDLTDGARGTSYQTTNSEVLGVHATGVVQARTRGTAQVVVNSRGKSSVITIPVRVPSPPDNHIPIPAAGPDLTRAREVFVELDGTGSHDADGDQIQYTWQQESGPTALLRDADTARPYFVTPFVTVETVLEFSLVVTDVRGATSFPDVIRIVVTP